MANKKFSDLTALTSGSTQDLIAIVDVSEDETKKITLDNLMQSGVTTVTSGSTINNNLYVGGLSTLNGEVIANTINGTSIIVTSSVTGVDGYFSGDLAVDGVVSGTTYVTIPSGTTINDDSIITGGTLDVTGLSILNTVDINAGNIDGTTIGISTRASGNFTTIAASDNITPDTLTASKPVFTDGSKNLVSTGVLNVDQGGTSLTAITDHSVMVGSGTDAITPIAVGTNGQLLVGSTDADPVFATVSDGEGIDTTLGAGTFQIDCEDATDSNKGIVELATDAETVTGTTIVLACTPANITAKMSAPGVIGNVTPNTITGTSIIATSGVTSTTGIFTSGVTVTEDIISLSQIAGGLENLTVTTSLSLSTQQCRGISINNYGQDSEVTPVLATCVEGLHGKVVMVTTGVTYHLDTQAADISYLDGTLLAAGTRISNISPTMDDELYFEAVPKTGGGWRWKFTGGQGAWIDGGV